MPAPGWPRSQVFARFAGEGAHADFTGLNLVENGQHCDITIDINHAVPNTTSQEMFKQIARGRSKAVFQGRIVVARDAQKTDAKMMMQGLMLSDEARNPQQARTRNLCRRRRLRPRLDLRRAGRRIRCST